MKVKRIIFEQYLSHDIDEFQQENVDDYLYSAMPLIGLVIMRFNGLEKLLDSIICQRINDRSDQLGLLVINKLSYSSKIDLFKRLSDDLLRCCGKSIDEYAGLINDLKECGRLRNIVAHADWDSTDHEGYTFLSVKINQDGILQEYVQFSIESLNKIVELIIKTGFKLGEVSEKLNDALYK